MKHGSHEQAIAEATEKIIALKQEKLKLGVKLNAIDAALKHWETILGSHRALNQKNIEKFPPRESKKIGITDGIRIMLRQGPERGLTPVEIRDKLTEYGIKSRNEKNFLVNIHSILKRMEDVEEVPDGEQEESGGKKRRWAVRRYRFNQEAVAMKAWD